MNVFDPLPVSFLWFRGVRTHDILLLLQKYLLVLDLMMISSNAARPGVVSIPSYRILLNSREFVEHYLYGTIHNFYWLVQYILLLKCMRSILLLAIYFRVYHPSFWYQFKVDNMNIVISSNITSLSVFFHLLIDFTYWLALNHWFELGGLRWIHFLLHVTICRYKRWSWELVARSWL